MAKLNFVKKAQDSKEPRKCIRCGTKIKPGDSYWWFANRIGRSSIRKNYCAKHRPRPSDMTTSDKLSQLYSAQESVEDEQNNRTDKDGVPISFDDYKSAMADALRSAADQARQVGGEYQESLDNMPEHLQESSGISERVEACIDWADALEAAADEVESFEYEAPDDLEDGEEPDMEAAYDGVDEIANGVVGELCI